MTRTVRCHAIKLALVRWPEKKRAGADDRLVSHLDRSPEADRPGHPAAHPRRRRLVVLQQSEAESRAAPPSRRSPMPGRRSTRWRPRRTSPAIAASSTAPSTSSTKPAPCSPPASITEAQSAAVESQTFSRAALSGKAGAENDAQFLTVEGDVQFQKSATSDWTPAETRTPLFNGDWVKTGERRLGGADLLQRLALHRRPERAARDLLAVQSRRRAARTTPCRCRSARSKWPRPTTSPASARPAARSSIDSESTTQVGVDARKSTDVVDAKKDRRRSRRPRAAPPVKLAAGEKVTRHAGRRGLAGQEAAHAAGAPDARGQPGLPRRRRLARRFLVGRRCRRRPRTSLQVSRSRLFTSLEINSRRQKTTASARVTAEGAFYWRVASVGAGRRYRTVLRRSAASASAAARTRPDTAAPEAPAAGAAPQAAVSASADRST